MSMAELCLNLTCAALDARCMLHCLSSHQAFFCHMLQVLGQLAALCASPSSAAAAMASTPPHSSRDLP
jgi:hypothetical protein